MAETTKLNKFRQKRLRSLTNQSKDDKQVSTFMYPKNNLYTRQEFELLDTIYSDEAPAENEKNLNESQEFWPTNKEEFLTNQPKSSIFAQSIWFGSGVMLASAIWLVYFLINVHEIRTKNDTQIVFQQSANIMTNENADKKLMNKLENKKENGKPLFKFSIAKALPKNINFSFLSFGKQQQVEKQEQVEVAKATTVQETQIQNVKYHTIGNGDSLWVIANKYYSNPSPANINKLVKVNHLKSVYSTLYPGQKIAIPL